MIRKTFSELNDAARAGYGKDWLKINKETGAPDPAALKMQQNLFKFSGAKTFAQLTELNRILTKGGKRMGWDEFRTEALRLNEKYNANHLQAEWQTANQAGHHMENWEQYVRNSKRFPNLKYKTQNDDRVRAEHEKLNGIIAPIDSPFWAKYYPPNGWRCRCYVVQTAESATMNVPDDIPEVLPEFRVNAGISGQVFSENNSRDAKQHAYFALAKDAGSKKLERSFERSKLAAPYNEVYKSQKDAKVSVSPFADLNDLPDNYTTAVKIADELGFSVAIRPHLNGFIIQNERNPEYDRCA